MDSFIILLSFYIYEALLFMIFLYFGKRIIITIKMLLLISHFHYYYYYLYGFSLLLLFTIFKMDFLVIFYLMSVLVLIIFTLDITFISFSYLSFFCFLFLLNLYLYRNNHPIHLSSSPHVCSSLPSPYHLVSRPKGAAASRDEEEVRRRKEPNIRRDKWSGVISTLRLTLGSQCEGNWKRLTV